MKNGAKTQIGCYVAEPSAPFYPCQGNCFWLFHPTNVYVLQNNPSNCNESLKENKYLFHRSPCPNPKQMPTSDGHHSCHLPSLRCKTATETEDTFIP